MQDGVLQASQMMFNVPVEPERALNPPQLSKRTARLQNRYPGQDPRRSRTAKGSNCPHPRTNSHPLLNNATLCKPARLVGPPSTRQWPARLYARAPFQLRVQRARRLTGVPPSLHCHKTHTLTHVLHPGALYPGGLPDPAFR